MMAPLPAADAGVGMDMGVDMGMGVGVGVGAAPVTGEICDDEPLARCPLVLTFPSSCMESSDRYLRKGTTRDGWNRGCGSRERGENDRNERLHLYVKVRCGRGVFLSVCSAAHT